MSKTSEHAILVGIIILGQLIASSVGGDWGWAAAGSLWLQVILRAVMWPRRDNDK